MASDPLAELGSFLTATEAERLALQFETGTPVSVAVREIAISRREQVKELLAAVADWSQRPRTFRECAARDRRSQDRPA